MTIDIIMSRSVLDDLKSSCLWLTRGLRGKPMLGQRYAISEVGGRSRNEDDYAISPVDAAVQWAIVADGLGGHSNGHLASRLVVETFADYMRCQPALMEDTLENAFKQCQQKLVRAREKQGKGADMATTLVALAWDNEHLAWLHCGDSRLYRARYGKIERLTQDQTLTEALKASGMFNEASLNEGSRNTLISVVGAENADPVISPLQKKKPGEIFLLCSDGWWDYLAEDVLQSTLAEANSIEQWIRAQADIVKKTQEEEADNFTGVAVAIE